MLIEGDTDNVFLAVDGFIIGSDVERVIGGTYSSGCSYISEIGGAVLGVWKG